MRAEEGSWENVHRLLVTTETRLPKNGRQELKDKRSKNSTCC